MKRTIIICSCIMFAAISGLTAFILLYNKSSEDAAGGTNMMNQNLLSMITEDMTFEDFSESFQDGLSEETLSEAEKIFDEIQEAMAAEDDDTLNDLLIQMNSLGLFANSNFGSRPDQGGFNITDVVGGSEGQMPQGGGPGGQGGQMPPGGGN